MMLFHPVPVLIIYDNAKAVPCLMISLVPSDKPVDQKWIAPSLFYQIFQ